jgi:hypothetical protein
VIFLLIGPRGVRMVDIEGILEEVVVKVMGHASRKNAFWLISMDRDCTRILKGIFNYTNYKSIFPNIGKIFKQNIKIILGLEKTDNIYYFYLLVSFLLIETPYIQRLEKISLI